MAVEQLLLHIPALRRYARLLTGDATRADDLVQDTLERACRKWRLWSLGTDLRAWLFTIMHNQFASQMRRAPPRAMVDIDEAAHELRAVDTQRDQAIDLQRCLLLLHREEIKRLVGKVEQKGYTLVPLNLHWKNGRVKCEIALAKGKAEHDKRDTIKDREGKREVERAMKSRSR